MPQKKKQVNAKPAADNATERRAFPLSRSAALAALDMHGVDGTSRAQLLDAAKGAEEGGGHPVSRLARHVLKWLPEGSKETTIPLTQSEATLLGLGAREP